MRTKDQGTLDKILKFVNKYYQENRVAPTISEVAAGVGVARSTTHRYIQELSDRDLLDYGRGILSAPESAKMKTAYIAAPLVGSIYCGSPEEEEENVEEYVSLPVSLFGKGDFYILRAKGDSMVDAGITEGDLLVIERNCPASEGDIVVALDQEQQNTLKRYVGFDNDEKCFSRMMLTIGGSKRNGLTPKTINGALSVLKNIFWFAEVEKSCAVADIKNISVRQPQKAMRILTRSEQIALSDYLCVNQTPCHLGILLCLYTGMRIGEICALKWGDIHIDEQYLYIHQSMQRVQTSTVSKSKTVVLIQSPKSECSIRKIPIPAEILQLLIPIKQPDEAFLLTGMTHKFLEPRSLPYLAQPITAYFTDNLSVLCGINAFIAICILISSYAVRVVAVRHLPLLFITIRIG